VSALRALAVALLLAPIACSSASSDWQVGGIYSFSIGDGTFGAAKVLAVDPGVVSVRIYQQTWPERPESVDPTLLSIGAIASDGGGFGVGHLPLDPRDFRLWWPVLVTAAEVTPAELEGYAMWKEAGGGVLRFPVE
jgi:hypothetical protein